MMSSSCRLTLYVFMTNMVFFFFSFLGFLVVREARTDGEFTEREGQQDELIELIPGSDAKQMEYRRMIQKVQLGDTDPEWRRCHLMMKNQKVQIY